MIGIVREIRVMGSRCDYSVGKPLVYAEALELTREGPQVPLSVLNQTYAIL